METNDRDYIEKHIREIKKGDKQALNDILEFLKPDLQKLVKSKINDNNFREDVYHNVLIKIMRTLPTIDMLIDFKPYFMMIARNEIMDFYRKTAKSKELLGADEMADSFANSYMTNSPHEDLPHEDFSHEDFSHEDFSEAYEVVIESIFLLNTAPFRILVYVFNRILYPLMYGGDRRRRGYPTLIVSELGNKKLLYITCKMGSDFKFELKPIRNELMDNFKLRLKEKENGKAYEISILLDFMGNDPAHTVSMWTDRINKQLVKQIIAKKMWQPEKKLGQHER